RDGTGLQIVTVDTAPLVEFGDKNVALLVKGNAVRRGHRPDAPLGGVGGGSADLIRVGIGAEYRNGLTRLIENDDLDRLARKHFGCGAAWPQLGDGGVVAVNRYRRGRIHVLGHYAEEVAFKGHMDDPAVCAIACDDAGRREAGIDGNLVK